MPKCITLRKGLCDTRMGMWMWKNEDLWKALNELCSRLDVTFSHVRAHAGHPENEECDRLAVAAIEQFRSRR